MKSRIALFSTLLLIGCQDVSNKVILLDDLTKFFEEMQRTSALLCKSDDTILIKLKMKLSQLISLMLFLKFGN